MNSSDFAQNATAEQITQVEPHVFRLTFRYGIHLIAQTDFLGYSHNPAKVSILTFSRHKQPCRFELLIDGNNQLQSLERLSE